MSKGAHGGACWGVVSTPVRQRQSGGGAESDCVKKIKLSQAKESLADQADTDPCGRGLVIRSAFNINN